MHAHQYDLFLELFYALDEQPDNLCVSWLKERKSPQCTARYLVLGCSQQTGQRGLVGTQLQDSSPYLSFVVDRNPAAPTADPRLPPQSCLLLPPTPARGGQKAVVSRKTNMHIFIESGLRVRINPKVQFAAHGGVPFNPLLNFQSRSFPL